MKTSIIKYKWDWDKQICLECSLRWVFGKNGCEPVDSNCARHQNDGTCTACYGGYVVINGKCAIKNILCKSTTEEGVYGRRWKLEFIGKKGTFFLYRGTLIM